MTTQVTPDVEILRREVQHKYTEVATTPDQTFHFHHLADIVVHKQVPDGAKANVDLWTAWWIGGALLEGEYLDAIQQAGFVDVELVSTADVFARPPGKAMLMPSRLWEPISEPESRLRDLSAAWMDSNWRTTFKTTGTWSGSESRQVAFVLIMQAGKDAGLLTE